MVVLLEDAVHDCSPLAAHLTSSFVSAGGDLTAAPTQNGTAEEVTDN
jgi:hypothetical protein